MSALSVALSAITVEGIPINVTIAGHEIQPEGVQDVPAGRVTILGKLSQVGDQYIFMGGLSGVYQHPCDRCLEPVEMPFSVDVIWDFEQRRVSAGPPTRALDIDVEDLAEDAREAASIFLVEGKELDLGRPAWEEFVLSAPSKTLCCEDCAGLCPRCGANLNRTRCACSQQSAAADNGFEKLVDLLSDLKPDPTKE